MDTNRRDFVKTIAVAGTAAAILPAAGLLATTPHGAFSLPKLPYTYDALEPLIDKMTMEIHHTKHHQAYVNYLNHPPDGLHLHDTVEDLCLNADRHNTGVRNNAGGHYNHSMFWKWMSPEKKTLKTGKLREALIASFGSIEKMQELFTEAATKRFGSGWAWIVVGKGGKLEIGSTPNQDNPLMPMSDFKGIPILGLDVWEHAYYLKYQNRRPEYIKAWWQLVNWDEVEIQFNSAKI